MKIADVIVLGWLAVFLSISPSLAATINTKASVTIVDPEQFVQEQHLIALIEYNGISEQQVQQSLNIHVGYESHEQENGLIPISTHLTYE